MIVITPGHEETRRIFDDCVHSEATYNQYALYNRYGYYSTELYELSQAGPVFDIGDAESDGYASSAALTGRVNIRRYLNYVNFPNMMWYEKFNWDLYSCSNTKDRDFPVYSISTDQLPHLHVDHGILLHAVVVVPLVVVLNDGDMQLLERRIRFGIVSTLKRKRQSDCLAISRKVRAGFVAIIVT